MAISLIAILSYCSNQKNDSKEVPVNELFEKDTILSVDSSTNQNNEEIDEIVLFDKNGKPTKPIFEKISIDTSILFGIWSSEHSFPNASFLINDQHYYIADYDGDGRIPYKLRGDSLTVFYEWGEQTFKIYIPNPNLLITESNNNSSYYERFDNDVKDFKSRHPYSLYFMEKIDSNIRNYTKVILENDHLEGETTDGGGELTGYFENNEIQKIVFTIGLSHGNSTIDIYYKNTELFLITETEKQFLYDEVNSTFDYTQTEITFYGQYLFIPEFDYQTLGHNRFENDELDPEIVLRDEASRYLSLLQNHIK